MKDCNGIEKWIIGIDFIFLRVVVKKKMTLLKYLVIMLIVNFTYHELFLA